MWPFSKNKSNDKNRCVEYDDDIFKDIIKTYNDSPYVDEKVMFHSFINNKLVNNSIGSINCESMRYIRWVIEFIIKRSVKSIKIYIGNLYNDLIIDDILNELYSTSDRGINIYMSLPINFPKEIINKLEYYGVKIHTHDNIDMDNYYLMDDRLVFVRMRNKDKDGYIGVGSINPKDRNIINKLNDIFDSLNYENIH